MKILVMGLPGAGKTYLAKILKAKLLCAYYNADDVRHLSNDFDFSLKGRLLQAERMRRLAIAEVEKSSRVICDFICPTRRTREIFKPDVLIWLDTIKESPYDDTNKMFEPPENNKCDYIIKIKNGEYFGNVIAHHILNGLFNANSNILYA